MTTAPQSKASLVREHMAAGGYRVRHADRFGNSFPRSDGVAHASSPVPGTTSFS